MLMKMANQEHENRTWRTRNTRTELGEPGTREAELVTGILPPPPFFPWRRGSQGKETERGLNSHHVGGCLQIYSTKAESQWIVAHRPLSQKRLTIPRPLLKSFTMDLFPRLLPILLNPSQQVFTLPRGPKCMIFAFPLL